MLNRERATLTHYSATMYTLQCYNVHTTTMAFLRISICNSIIHY